MENKTKEQLEQLSEIRDMMKESTQFLSLSGMSGVFAGLFALIGAALVWTDFFQMLEPGYFDDISVKDGSLNWKMLIKVGYLLTVGCGVLLLSLVVGFVLTAKKARKHGRKLFDFAAKKLLLNLFIPLLLGGVFCVALVLNGYVGAVAPATLMFYGLALLNAGKYTYRDIRYLGICEMTLGVIAMIFMGNGLYFWACGFGIFHVIYGLAMFIKYDRS
ncbi:hypothetical protein OAW23_10605 [Flavobacteriales bacterium]|nr:hypothetical protein [Flavobacteriales bacterium]